MNDCAASASASASAAAAERKRKRLEAWRKRQQLQQTQETNQGDGVVASEHPPPVKEAASDPAPSPGAITYVSPPKVKVKVSLGLGFAGKKKKRKKKNKGPVAGVLPLLGDGEDDDDDGVGGDLSEREKDRRQDLLTWDGTTLKDVPSTLISETSTTPEETAGGERPKKRSRWDSARQDATQPQQEKKERAGMSTLPLSVDDALDKFMDQLEVLPQTSDGVGFSMSINVGGTMQQKEHKRSGSIPPPPGLAGSGGVITAEDLQRLQGTANGRSHKSQGIDGGNESNTLVDGQVFTHSDWESDAKGGATADSGSEAETDIEEEEKARREFLEALKKSGPELEVEKTPQLQIRSEVASEKNRRDQRIQKVKKEAELARKIALEQANLGRMFNDGEGGVMEEAERALEVLTAAPDALDVLAELNKKKELKAVDHSQIEYIPIRKNLFVLPKVLASLSSDDVTERRAALRIRVRGNGSPPPVSTFRECGLSERMMQVLEKQNISDPFPIQAQCVPIIMAGRDVIGIAKTGSGKTLAYLLPMLRHILDQPSLAPGESGPIGLVLAPARELAFQIHNVCKVFAKNLGIKSTAVYGGAGVAEQIGDLKRGTHIAVATPGRMIDILTMQSGKILSLRRVSYVVMDEADRMFDMGFAPQISAILSAVRPDRQTVLFSATFPKAVETLARKALQFPVEVLVGGRSVASDSVTQYGEVIEEEDKFLRLLQLLGNVKDEEKVIVFVNTQVLADSIFEQLLHCGYPSMSLHGGKEQEDRDSTLSDFKRKGGPNVLVATSVAGRGLDVPSCSCVINYSAPNHLEDYVHRVGRTGRAGNTGSAYTFVDSGDEIKFAPIVVRAMIEAGQAQNISTELRKLSDTFKEKVKKGEARWAGSGFKGKGYSYDSSEVSEAQKLACLEKREALIEAGMLDADDEDQALATNGPPDEGAIGSDISASPDKQATDMAKDKASGGFGIVAGLQSKLSVDLLALPGMQEAIMKKAGLAKEDQAVDASESSAGIRKTGDNHFITEVEINDYPQQARWKVTQKETANRLQDDFQTAVTLKGEYYGPNRTPAEGERKLYLNLEAKSGHILKNCVHEIQRLLNEETLRVGTRGGTSGHKYSVL